MGIIGTKEYLADAMFASIANMGSLSTIVTVCTLLRDKLPAHISYYDNLRLADVTVSTASGVTGGSMG
jgi:hypothetical protein